MSELSPTRSDDRPVVLTESGPGRMVDPRGPRFAAAVTTIVLAVALLLIPQVSSVVVVFAQALVFGVAALFGLRYQAYGWLYRRTLARRLSPPAALEPEAPPQFAQQVGFVFMVVALVGLAVGIPLMATVAVACALAAAFLNAVFNFCLGCEIYLLGARLRHRRKAGRQAREAGADEGALESAQ